MIGVELYTEVLPISIRVLQCNRHEVRLRVDGAVVAQSKRMVERRTANGTPEIDNLESALKERLSVDGGEMPMDSPDRACTRLINVYGHSWLALLRIIAGFPRDDDDE